jgi:CheY-like chemotaxis protein
MQPQARARDLDIALRVPEGFPAIWGDRDRLVQAVAILLSNAVKFSREGGVISMEGALREAGTIALTVRDQGIGITPNLHEKVFDKFFQVDSSMTRSYGGAGIGLSIAKAIVEAHGGAIELESVPKEGSAFTIVLPNAAFEAASAPCGGAEAPERVLLVERMAEFRDVLRALVEAAGGEAREAAQGFEARRISKEWEPTVILVGTPEDGASLERVLELCVGDGALWRPGVVVMADAHEAPGLAERETLCSVVVLEKPFTAEQLAQAVEVSLAMEDIPQVIGADGGGGDTEPATPRVLVVESDPDHLSWLAAVVHLHEIGAYCTGDSYQAVQWAREQQPALVLWDVDGVETPESPPAAYIRRQLHSPGAMVYLMTGAAVEDVDGAEADGILVKPFSGATLEEILAGMLQDV